VGSAERREGEAAVAATSSDHPSVHPRSPVAVAGRPRPTPLAGGPRLLNTWNPLGGDGASAADCVVISLSLSL
jgi:hypothetical protein